MRLSSILCVAAVVALSLPAHANAAPFDTLTFKSVTAGATHTCALTANGRAYCWGGNSEGQLGTGAQMEALIPTAVAGDLTFLQIDAGIEFTCGVTTDGAAYCWGRNVTGALGNSATPRSLVPVPVTGGLTFRAVSAGGDHACGITEDLTAYCWGSNASGQLGTGDSAAAAARPLPVAGGLRFVSITAGDDHTCGITTDSVAYCWGSNSRGQLGIGEHGDRRRPELVIYNRKWLMLSAGARHTCGLVSSSHRNTVYCFGDNFHAQGRARNANGQLRNFVEFRPEMVIDSPNISSVSSGRWHTCIAREHWVITVGCFGSNLDYQLGEQVIGNYVQVSAGDAHTCALREDGAIYCWGKNAVGQLGDGTVYNQRRPVRVVAPARAHT